MSSRHCMSHCVRWVELNLCCNLCQTVWYQVWCMSDIKTTRLLFCVCVCSHLIADEVNLVLDLGNPLPNDGEQLRDGGLRIHENLQTGWIIGIKEGESCRETRNPRKLHHAREHKERKAKHTWSNEWRAGEMLKTLEEEIKSWECQEVFIILIRWEWTSEIGSLTLSQHCSLRGRFYFTE